MLSRGLCGIVKIECEISSEVSPITTVALPLTFKTTKLFLNTSLLINLLFGYAPNQMDPSHYFIQTLSVTQVNRIDALVSTRMEMVNGWGESLDRKLFRLGLLCSVLKEMLFHSKADGFDPIVDTKF